MTQTLSSTRVVTADGIRPATIVFENGKILSVEPGASNGDDFYVLPGLTDTHVHVNEPGRTHWEGFATATAAAAAGGYTCIVDMPLNSIPATTSVAALGQKRQAAESKSRVDVEFWGGVVPGNESEIEPLARAGVRGFKCFLVNSGVDEFSHVSEDDLDRAMPIIAKTGLPLLVHAELPGPLQPSQTNWERHSTHLQSRPEQAEIEAIELMIRLSQKHQCRVHIVHLATASGLPLLRKGAPAITVETCPHYLYFASETVPDLATQFKCAPPIRSAENRELLWEGLRDGTIDLIATDHSPCPPELKQGDFGTAWGGIASLSVALPVIWTAARQRGFGLEDVVRWMSTNTARLAGLDRRKGRIAPGYDADLVVFDPDASFTVTPERLHFRHPVTPYLGETLQGEVRQTFVRGRVQYENGAPDRRDSGSS